VQESSPFSKDIVACGAECACHADISILLMPEADAVPMECIGNSVSDLLDQLEKAGVFWPDPRPLNVLNYEGRLVATDFGIP